MTERSKSRRTQDADYCIVQLVCGTRGLVLLCELNDAPKLAGAFGPSEGTAGLVLSSDVSVEEALQLPARAMDALLQGLFGHDAKEAFDEVDPGSVRRAVMKAGLGMRGQPLRGGGIVVGVEIVEHDAKPLLATLGDDRVHELEKGFAAAVVTHMGGDFAGL